MLTALLLSLRMLAYLTYAPLLILPEPCHRRKIFCASVVVIRHRSSLHGCSYMKKTRCKHTSRFLWRRHPDLNWGIKVLQTSALPLGYVAGLARVAGFEPADDGIRIRCLTTWRYPNIYVGWVVGFEPTYTGATTLGLNHLTIPTIFICL